MNNATTTTIPGSELFTALTGEPAPATIPLGFVDPAGAIEVGPVTPAQLSARTRNTGRRIWQKRIDQTTTNGGTTYAKIVHSWADIDSPPLADLAAANRWLEAELTAGRLTGGVYRPASVQEEVEAVVGTVTSVRLT